MTCARTGTHVVKVPGHYPGCISEAARDGKGGREKATSEAVIDLVVSRLSPRALAVRLGPMLAASRAPPPEHGGL